MSGLRFDAFTAPAGALHGRCYDCDALIQAGQRVKAVPGSYHGCGTHPAWSYRHVNCRASVGEDPE